MLDRWKVIYKAQFSTDAAHDIPGSPQFDISNMVKGSAITTDTCKPLSSIDLQVGNSCD